MTCDLHLRKCSFNKPKKKDVNQRRVEFNCNPCQHGQSLVVKFMAKKPKEWVSTYPETGMPKVPPYCEEDRNKPPESIKKHCRLTGPRRDVVDSRLFVRTKTWILNMSRYGKPHIQYISNVLIFLVVWYNRYVLVNLSRNVLHWRFVSGSTTLSFHMLALCHILTCCTLSQPQMPAKKIPQKKLKTFLY